MMAAEYGDLNWRPHYHAVIFGLDWSADRTLLKTVRGNPIFVSPALTKLWGNGFASVGNLTFESACYVARYVMKKQLGDGAKAKHYGGRTPEFSTMSRRPGIGKAWFDKFHKDVYPYDEVIINGIPTKPPRYYDQKLEEMDQATAETIREKRAERAKVHRRHNTPERLAARKELHQLRYKRLKREL